MCGDCCCFPVFVLTGRRAREAAAERTLSRLQLKNEQRLLVLDHHNGCCEHKCCHLDQCRGCVCCCRKLWLNPSWRKHRPKCFDCCCLHCCCMQRKCCSRCCYGCNRVFCFCKGRCEWNLLLINQMKPMELFQRRMAIPKDLGVATSLLRQNGEAAEHPDDPEAAAGDGLPNEGSAKGVVGGDLQSGGEEETPGDRNMKEKADRESGQPVARFRPFDFSMQVLLHQHAKAQEATHQREMAAERREQEIEARHARSESRSFGRKQARLNKGKGGKGCDGAVVVTAQPEAESGASTRASRKKIQPSAFDDDLDAAIDTELEVFNI